jgi:DtxR family Mn-dependent transcriptional regulator
MIPLMAREDSVVVNDTPIEQRRIPSQGEARYLEAIATVGRNGQAVSGAALARALDVSAPTVHEMVRRLARDGFIERTTDRGWRLTRAGHHEATALRRRRHVVEQFLRTVLPLSSEEVASEAELLVTAVSPRLEEHLRQASWPGERPCETSPLADHVQRLAPR